MVALALGVGLAACEDEDPVEVVFQVIEETEFAASLGIDLTQMQRLSNGVYRQDLVVGTGPALEWGQQLTMQYSGWLSDGTAFATDEDYTFTMGTADAIVGLQEGLVGMPEGGTRRLIIPPELAYGGQNHPLIPPGSILVFEVVLVQIG